MSPAVPHCGYLLRSEQEHCVVSSRRLPACLPALEWLRRVCRPPCGLRDAHSLPGSRPRLAICRSAALATNVASLNTVCCTVSRPLVSSRPRSCSVELWARNLQHGASPCRFRSVLALALAHSCFAASLVSPRGCLRDPPARALLLPWPTRFVSQSPLNESYLVDPASSHMLVSKIKPCMSKFTLFHGETANGSLNQSRFLR